MIIWIFCSSTGQILRLCENDAWKAGNAGAGINKEAYKDGKVYISVRISYAASALMPPLKRLKLCHMSIKFFGSRLCLRRFIAYCQERDILLEAYSPLGTGSIFGNEDVEAVAERNGKSVAQVAFTLEPFKRFLATTLS